MQNYPSLARIYHLFNVVCVLRIVTFRFATKYHFSFYNAPTFRFAGLICSLLDSNRYNFSYLYIPPRIPISIPAGLKEKEALFYVTLVDCLPDLLIKHKVLIYNSKSNKKVRYYYKVSHGEIYFYLNDGTLFYSSVQSIID